ncbi:hypothetical protein CRE_14134 [Caenorhabditis remanei]|uniref:Uncharacterized protein n=1 Tax=Caenorhabditis remanei TaxID=31234 RepID=E3MRF0_CAERE|nr:hypothetical protein CRE_14134 [Caenorhabditis remanei]
MILHSIFLYLIFLLSVHSIIPNHFHFSDNFRKVDPSQLNEDISVSLSYLIQPLDPLSPESTKKFQQRYRYSEHFTSNKKTAFLYVSGRDDFNEAVLKNDGSPLVKAAERFGATIFALEHRYYGNSTPNFENFTSESLQHLDSYHAIQDVIFFIEHANTQFKMDSDVRWVLFGSGYGGIIAAETRKWDPITVSGVVAISAPIEREMDFWKYNNKVEKTIMKYDSSCYNKIKKGFRQVQDLMNFSEGRNELSDLFELNPPWNERDLALNEIQMFYLSIIAPFQQVVQYDNQLELSIKGLCDAIHDSRDSVEAIHQAHVYLSTQLTGSMQQMNSTYEKYVNDLGSKILNCLKDYQHKSCLSAQKRFWQYQMCTEFGWFPTTNDNEDGLFGSVVPLSLFFNQCFDIFPDLYKNETAIKIRDDIEKAKNFYGKYSGTNAVFINGENDPWTVLGRNVSDEFSVVTLTVPRASHLGIYKQKEIRKVQEIVMENIRVWVRGPKNSVTFMDTVEPWRRPETYDANSKSSKQKMSKQENDDRFSKFVEKFSSEKKESEDFHFFGMKPIARKFRGDEDEVFDTEGMEIGMFRQRIDHFNNKNTKFFQQKYFKNSRFARPGGPNFLMIGGEGPEYGHDVNLNSSIMRRAEEYGGTVYVLEHRFYGDSVVENNTDLSTLSSLQMLYDLAEFIKSVNFKSETSNPWITFGGSYPGALSAWMREIFPDLVIGAIASSAPVLAKTDFYEYMMVVENSFLRYDSACYQEIKNGFDEIHELFQTDSGREKLSVLFKLNPPFRDNISESDKHFFFFDIIGPFQFAVQYAGRGSGGFVEDSKIAMLCRNITNGTQSSVENVAKVVLDDFKNKSIIHSFYDKNKWKHMKKTNENYLWRWQTCSEFGYFQSADSGNSIFGAMKPVSFQVQRCMEMFGKEYTRGKIEENVEATNYRYGGVDGFRGTNVVFINGDVDPWHILGLYNSTEKSVVSYLINGTSHCVDMYPPQDNDIDGVKIARKLVDDNIKVWLEQTGWKAETRKESTTEGSITEMVTVTERSSTTKSTVSNTFFVSMIVSVAILCRLYS